jgi:hypothetical protein
MHAIDGSALSHHRGVVMILQKNQIEQPFMFWLIRELFATEQGIEEIEEEMKPIGNREFYTWMSVLFAALLVYGTIFKFFAA